MKLPFKIDFGARKPLSQQVADGFRLAIKEGAYRDGEALPTLRELAAHWNVSIRVPGRAYARLADEGYVILRPGRGAVACRSGVRSWNGNVLFVSVGAQGGFFMPHFLQALRQGIEEANMRFYTAVVPTPPNGEGPDFGRFAAYLSQPYDLVILLTDNPRLRTMVRRGASKSLIVGRSCTRAVSPDILISADEGEQAFVEDCRRAGVRHVRVLAYGRARCPVVNRLKAIGVRVELVRVYPVPGLLIGEGIQRAAHDYWTDARLRLKKLPELVYFADDNLALGSLIAFAEQGLRVPDDLAVVSMSNRGSALPFACDLARVETDPVRIGRETARRALDCIRSGELSSASACPSVYRPGASFPVVR